MLREMKELAGVVGVAAIYAYMLQRPRFAVNAVPSLPQHSASWRKQADLRD